MFGLGVFVGRGSSPVLFETRPFQERLGKMVREFSFQIPEKKKVDLKFYDVLEEPEDQSAKGGGQDLREITPGPETGKPDLAKSLPQKNSPDKIPVKHSRKLTTWHKTVPEGAAARKSRPDTFQKSAAAPKAYTIQIASYKDLDDALEQMGRLGKKGIAAYRVTVEINKETWYRIRTGVFTDLESAKARLAALSEKGISGIVTKKE